MADFDMDEVESLMERVRELYDIVKSDEHPDDSVPTEEFIEDERPMDELDKLQIEVARLFAAAKDMDSPIQVCHEPDED